MKKSKTEEIIQSPKLEPYIFNNMFSEYILKNKHQIHHLFPNKNHFLLDPTFDILFNTYK